jgi:DNA-binding SARP family transcriptional activator
LRREHLRDSHLFVLTRLADYAFQDGDYYSCIGWCEQLLAEDRCRENTYRLLMRSHARLGQPGRVRRWYDLCVHTLRTELDADVDESTEREHNAIMGSMSNSRVQVRRATAFGGAHS